MNKKENYTDPTIFFIKNIISLFYKINNKNNTKPDNNQVI